MSSSLINPDAGKTGVNQWQDDWICRPKNEKLNKERIASIVALVTLAIAAILIFAGFLVAVGAGPKPTTLGLFITGGIVGVPALLAS